MWACQDFSNAPRILLSDRVIKIYKQDGLQLNKRVLKLLNFYSKESVINILTHCGTSGSYFHPLILLEAPFNVKSISVKACIGVAPKTTILCLNNYSRWLSSHSYTFFKKLHFKTRLLKLLFTAGF
jgi:hypothetical protein